MATAYTLRPEVAGGFGPQSELDTSKHPPVVNRLHYEFAGWLGDDIVATFPSSIVTEELAQAIAKEGLTGVQFGDVVVTKDPQFERFFPDQAAALPKWRWLRPVGKPHVSDFWQDEKGILYVSERALNLLRRFNLQHGRIGEVGSG